MKVLQHKVFQKLVRFQSLSRLMLATATVKEDISPQQHFSESILKHTEILPLKRDMSRSIFCNVELNCANVEAVGFDMDFTLAQVRICVLLTFH